MGQKLYFHKNYTYNNYLISAQCPEGQAYTTCGGCEGTCQDQTPICLAVCLEGCFCKAGYVKENGTCIPLESCPKRKKKYKYSVYV